MSPRGCALIAACAALGGAISCTGTRDLGDPGEPLPIQPPAPEPRPDEKPGFIAVLTPKSSADVMAPYTSASASLVVKLGDTVDKGQTLARLDDRQLRQELDAARAQLRTAQSTVGQAAVEKRTADLTLAREKHGEATGVTSHADVVNATQNVAKAAAALAVAQATANERSTRVAQLEAHIHEMTLVAPIAGSVALIYAQDGARVEEGRPVVRVIAGGVFVKFAIPADKSGAIKIGDAVDVQIDRRSEPLTATVSHIAPELDAVAQMIIADADLVNPPADLQPGTVGRIVSRAPPPAK